MTLTHCRAFGNETGFFANKQGSPHPAIMYLDYCTATGNSGPGIETTTGAIIYIANCVSAGNVLSGISGSGQVISTNPATNLIDGSTLPTSSVSLH
jgi:hypothetical protein